MKRGCSINKEQKLKSTANLNIKSGSLLIGQRIPKEYFTTRGVGESDLTIHAGSYHLALKQAGIEMCNIMTYSSIMPPQAVEIQKPSTLPHGAVMECIVAVAHSTKGKRATAGIVYGWLYDKLTGKRFGGLVCEYNNSDPKEVVERNLRASLNELYVTGFSDKYDLKDVTVILEEFTPKKKYGTALVAICFTSYIVPILRG